MGYSKLVSYKRMSPNYSLRTAPVSKITIHHMAGNFSLESVGNSFASTTRQASANYGIDSKGKIALYVDEKHRAWTSSNKANDNCAVTIEVANDGGAATGWHVSDAAYDALINLCVDICKRNNIKALNYTGDRNGNLTRHNMFTATSCPGNYLQSKFPQIAQEVNKRLAQNGAEQKSYLVRITASVLNVRSGVGVNYPIVTQVKKGEAFTIVDEVNGWGKLKSGKGWISLKYTERV